MVVGAGATGGYFGTRLAHAGRDVTFLVRNGRAETLRRRGLRITGLGQNDVIEPSLVTATDLSGLSDLIRVTVKSIRPRKCGGRSCAGRRPRNRPDSFLNGMAHMDALETAFGADRVLGGIVRLVTTVTKEGDILQMNPLATLTIGEQSGPPSDRVRRALATLIADGSKASTTPDALASMWHKWVFIVAAGAATCLLRGSVGAIVSVPGGDDFVHTVLAEAESVPAAAGYPVPDYETETSLGMLSEPRSTFTSSLYRDVIAGLPNETERLLGVFTRRARSLNIRTPLIDLALLQLRVHAATT